MRKTKIIATLGPSVGNEKMVKRLIEKGMDVARLNFSHGDHASHKVSVDMLKKVRMEMDKPVALLLDTKGPEVRIGTFAEREVELVEDQEFRLVSQEILGDNTKVSLSYKELYKDLRSGSKVLINDGLVELVVEKIEGTDIVCKVINGGVIGDRKGVNLPEANLNLPSLTEQDVADIVFAIENDFDFIAASFVRKPKDVIEIKKVLEKYNDHSIRIISKIENREGIDHAEEIIKISDGIMVARGDLGVEVPVEEVPILQKELIEKCYRNGKPVITATQMLDSMIRNPRPTRAETSDVANAIYDGTSAIMLSGETAAGKYPIESLETMSRIACKAESAINYWKAFDHSEYANMASVTNAISHATCTTAEDLGAAAIITVTHTGNTARMISRLRPACPIIATTISEKVRRQLSLSWGITPVVVKQAATTDEIFEAGVEKAVDVGAVKNGDMVVITAGVPIGVSGTTNILKVHTVGKVLVSGKGVGDEVVTGQLCVANNTEEVHEKFNEGDILVLPYTNNDMLDIIRRSSAIVVEESEVSAHAATVGLALGIPVIIAADNATKLLKSGRVVTVDATRGIVYYGSN
jgi:pyruvate kinase